MPRDATLHVKLDQETDRHLKRLAASRGKSKGALVREAIASCYPRLPEDLPAKQRQALSAYQGGFISLGKLARVMGIHALDLRRWLNEHGIPQSIAYAEQDAANA